jgi:hypothetical protein
MWIVEQSSTSVCKTFYDRPNGHTASSLLKGSQISLHHLTHFDDHRQQLLLLNTHYSTSSTYAMTPLSTKRRADEDISPPNSKRIKDDPDSVDYLVNVCHDVIS